MESTDDRIHPGQEESSDRNTTRRLRDPEAQLTTGATPLLRELSVLAISAEDRKGRKDREGYKRRSLFGD